MLHFESTRPATAIQSTTITNQHQLSSYSRQNCCKCGQEMRHTCPIHHPHPVGPATVMQRKGCASSGRYRMHTASSATYCSSYQVTPIEECTPLSFTTARPTAQLALHLCPKAQTTFSTIHHTLLTPSLRVLLAKRIG